MKIIINTTHIDLLGGVSNHFKGLKNYWTEDVSYNYIGGRFNIPGAVILPFDLLKFIFKIIFFSPDLILLNPSLGRTAIKRDAIYLKLAKLFELQVIVFFHGWDEDLAKEIDKAPGSFIEKFKQADALILLANEFKQRVKGWGFESPVYLTTTKVNDKLIEDFDISQKRYSKNLLFLARIEKKKGIFMALDIFDILQQKHEDSTLTVAGDGGALADAKQYVENKKIKNVYFTGFITGNELINTFLNSDIYLFPTQHGEGMPTSVLEAMAFGLPIITRPVGGVVDFFENGKMGYLIEDLIANDYVEKIKCLIHEKGQMEKIGRYNHEYVKQNFLSSMVVKKLENIFEEVCQKRL